MSKLLMQFQSERLPIGRPILSPVRMRPALPPRRPLLPRRLLRPRAWWPTSAAAVATDIARGFAYHRSAFSYSAKTKAFEVSGCCFIQSRKCSDNSLSGQWLRVTDIPASRTIHQGGTDCFKFASTGDECDTPGTLHTGWTAVANCSDPACIPRICTPCGGTPPSKVRVDLSGLTLCPGCYANGSGGWAKFTGAFGIYDMLWDPTWEGLPSSCRWSLPYQVESLSTQSVPIGVTRTTYLSSSCTGATTGPLYDQGVIAAVFNYGLDYHQWDVSVFMGMTAGVVADVATGLSPTTSDCTASQTITETATLPCSYHTAVAFSPTTTFPLIPLP